MKIKVLLLTLSGIVLLLGMWVGSSIWKGYKNGMAGTTDHFLKDVVLLEKLTSQKGVRAEKKLANFASRKDAVGYYANIGLAERYIKNKKADPVAYYNRAFELYDSKSLRKKIGSCLEGQGKLSEAADMYASALPDGGALDSLLKTNAEPEIIVSSLLKYGRYQDAADYIKPKLSENIDEKKKAVLESQYGLALGQLGLYKDSLPFLEKSQRYGDSDAEIKWWYGRALETLGQTGKAKAVYSSIGPRGAYRLGLILEGEGKLNEAAKTFVSSSEAVSIWRGACLYDQLGSLDKAVDIYQLLARGNSGFKDDAAYRAYMLITQNKLPGADEMLSLIKSYPAWMARLGRKNGWNVPDIKYEKPVFLNRVEAYKRSGRQAMADIELAIGQKQATAAEKGALAEWYLKQGNMTMAAAWAAKAISEQPGLRAYRIAYPKPFEDDVKKASAEFNVDENLIWALMREESSFQPDAVSKAGAQGLMQLMPATAMGISSRLKASVDGQGLMEPGVNIRFGTYYIRSMLDMFSGDTDKALAAYNAGSGNVKKWSSTKVGSSKGGFPTAITYFETREYITKVMNSYYIYSNLY